MPVLSPQTLAEADRRLVAGWAADCAQHVLPIFEQANPGDTRPRDLIVRARAFARGESGTASQIRRRFVGGVPASDVPNPAAYSAARAAGQAAAVAHMGAHALGAAGYATLAAELDASDPAHAADAETQWQLEHMSEQAGRALRTLPRVGANPSGPLGPGLLSSGRLGAIIADLQARLASGR